MQSFFDEIAFFLGFFLLKIRNGFNRIHYVTVEFHAGKGLFFMVDHDLCLSPLPPSLSLFLLRRGFDVMQSEWVVAITGLDRFTKVTARKQKRNCQ